MIGCEFLHKILGYVPQKAVMFGGSVNENISYGESFKEITDKKEKRKILNTMLKFCEEKGYKKEEGSHIY